ncbi:MAG: IPT/TIG domain-containing protein [Cytophagaceae bacterium]
MLIIYLLLISFPFSKAHSDGACMLEPVSLQKRTEQATLIVEGLVTNLEIVKDNNSGNIFTLYTITLSGILKGYSSENEIKILAQGGKTENEWHIVTGSLSLHPGDKGIFFCQPVNHRKNTYQSYAAAQGFIKYHEDETHAHDPFFTYKNIQEDLVQKIERIAGTPYKKIYNPEKRIGLVPDIIPSTLPVIQNLNPTTITGGTFQPLTITGSGFGSIQGSGYVEFKNCNDGGNSYIRPLSSDYISWSDTEIKVKVPSSPCAGTGDVRIVNHGGGSTQSLQILTVTYSCLNINSNGFARLPSLVNMDMKGGQTFHMNSSFEENEKAREAFLRALTSWRCATGVTF